MFFQERKSVNRNQRRMYKTNMLIRIVGKGPTLRYEQKMITQLYLFVNCTFVIYL